MLGRCIAVVPHLLVFFFSNSLNGNLIKPESAKNFGDEEADCLFLEGIFSRVGLGPKR